MESKDRLDQLESIVAELIHSNEISERRLSVSEERLSILERLQYITIPIPTLAAAGTLFAIYLLLVN